jgi:inward rectifier potassium channel
MTNLRMIPEALRRDRELGFGSQIPHDQRMMNPDGSFNVRRHRNSLFDNLYFHLVTMPSRSFFGLLILVFWLLNALFAEIYILIGVDQLSGLVHTTWWADYQKAFFFSSQTLTTVGYGSISPMGLEANVVASFESFLGLLTFALISGLLYGRFSRPTARIRFSDNLLHAPYKGGGNALMFRMVNPRRSELIETEVQVILALLQEDANGHRVRRFLPLDLELNKITFFSLSWTLVHALNERSPIQNFTQEELKDARAEFLVLVKGTDESTEQLVHARRSYIADEIVWNARFKPILQNGPTGKHSIIHTKRVNDHEVL